MYNHRIIHALALTVNVSVFLSTSQYSSRLILTWFPGERATARPATTVLICLCGFITCCRCCMTLWLCLSRLFSCSKWTFGIKDSPDCAKCGWLHVCLPRCSLRHHSMLYDGLGYFVVLTGKDHRQELCILFIIFSQFQIFSTSSYIEWAIRLFRSVISWYIPW
jgi:hypothetical protein